MRVQLRTDRAQQARAGALLLDAYDPVPGHDPASTVQIHAIADRSPGRPRGAIPPAASEFLWFAIAACLADVVVRRADAPDGWTRSIELSVPLSNGRWTAAALAHAAAMLGFLTGDRWSIDVTAGGPSRALTIPVPVGDAVCLLSGGLDSLVGSIDLLADGRRTVLVGAQDSGVSANRQRLLGQRLADAYQGQVDAHRVGARPRRPGAQQAVPLQLVRENTTRSRSLLFVAWAMAYAAALGPDTEVYLPENGMIGINVPVSPSRVGSLSTRTTHPHFIGMLRELLSGTGITNPLSNPYRLMTKGQAMQHCAHPGLLRDLAPMTLSCAHPLARRYQRRTGSPRGCGYCYPCLVRRAAMHTVGLDDPRGYDLDVLANAEFLGSESNTRASLQAVVAALHRPPSRLAVLRNGPVPLAEIGAFAAVHQEGIAELGRWLGTATAQHLIQALR